MIILYRPVIAGWLCICLSLLSAAVHGQTFQKSYNHPDLSVTFGDITQTPDGGFLCVGQAFPVALDSISALLYKLDSSLEVEWTKRYKFLSRDDFAGITPTADGNYLIYGTTRQDFTLTCGGSLIKVDLSGNVIWSRYYDESCDDRTIAVFENPDGTLQLFIRLGVTGRATKLLHTSATGEILSKFFFEFGDEEVKVDEVIRDAAGDYYLAGMVRDDTVLSQFYAAKYDGSSVLWSNLYKTGRSSQSLAGIGFLPDGKIGITGQVFVDSSTSNFNVFLMKLGTDGSLLEAFEMDNSPFEFGSWVTSLSDGSFILSGNFTSPVAKATMSKFSATGDLLWSRAFGNDADFVLGGKVIELSDGRLLQLARRGGGHLIMADDLGRTPCDAYTFAPEMNNFPITVSPMPLTTTTPPVVDLALPLTVTDVLVTSETICLDTTVIANLEEEGFLQDGGVFPNPVRDMLVLKGLASGQRFTIVSISGAAVFSGIAEGPHTVVDVADLPKGIYIVPELGAKFVKAH